MHYADPKFSSNWFSKLRVICKEKGVEVLFNGGAYGTDYNTIVGYEHPSLLENSLTMLLMKFLTLNRV